MKNMKLLIGLSLVVVCLLYWCRQHTQINTQDACLCTELLASSSLTAQKDKIKAVRDCEMLFEDFEKAHLKCMETVPFENPTLKKDTIKSVST